MTRAEKNKVRLKAWRALRTGQLVKQPCEYCGTTKRVEMHHADYTKPLQVRWLCKQHHYGLHRHGFMKRAGHTTGSGVDSSTPRI